MSITDRLADRLTLPRGRRIDDPETDPPRDIHEVDEILGSDQLLDEFLTRAAPQEAAGSARLLREIKHRGRVQVRVWDYRHLASPNGGRIRLLGHVDHIPVIRQMAGRADIEVLLRVLKSQGLMVQRATDADGNVALFTEADRLCFHARGGNSLLCGTEHMHQSVTEPWANRQLNAAAYIRAQLFEHRGVPRGQGILGSGSGFVTVRKRGHVSHETVSRKAGFNDRSDPGARFPEDEVRDRAVFFVKHGHF